MHQRVPVLTYLLAGLVLAACAPAAQRSIVLSPYSDLNAFEINQSYEGLKKDYSVSETVSFGQDPVLLQESLELSKENINLEVPERRLVATATLWDIPLIKAFLRAQHVGLRSSVGEEIRTRLMDDHRNFSQFLLSIDSTVNRYFYWGDWSVWLKDKNGATYIPKKVQESFDEELILPVNKIILGKQTRRPAYKVYHDSARLYFQKLNLPALSPLTLVLADAEQKRKIELVFNVSGTPPVFLGAEPQTPAWVPEAEEPPSVSAPSPSEPALSPVDRRERMRLHFEQATAHFRNQDYREAIAEWENVLELDPTHKLSQVKIEKARQALEEIEVKERVYSEQQKKRQMQVRFLMATELFRNGQYQDAINEWEEVLKIDPNHELSLQKIEKAQQMLQER